MNFIGYIIPQQLINGFGWTIIHSLWQGAAVAFGFALLMVFMRRFSSRARYAVGVAALTLMFTLSAVTFVNVYQKGEAGKIPGQETAREMAAAGPHLKGTPSLLPNQSREASNFGLSYFARYFKQHLPLVVTLWLMGILALALRLTGGYLLNLRLKTHRATPLTNHWQDRLKTLCKKARINTQVQWLESALVKVPMTIGHFKPVILFPLGLATGLPREQVEALVAHELAHIFRKDYIVNIFQNILEIIFFYHPAVWWISSHIRSERENCCDDMAVALSGDSMNFARALTRIQGFGQRFAEPALAVTGKKHGLMTRVKRLFDTPKNRPQRKDKFIGASLLALFALFLVVGANAASVPAAQTHPPEKPSPVNLSPEKPLPVSISSVKPLPVKPLPEKPLPVNAPVNAVTSPKAPKASSTTPAKPGAPGRPQAPPAAPAATNKTTSASKERKASSVKVKNAVVDFFTLAKDGTIQIGAQIDTTRIDNTDKKKQKSIARVIDNDTGKTVWQYRIPAQKKDSKNLHFWEKVSLKKGTYKLIYDHCVREFYTKSPDNLKLEWKSIKEAHSQTTRETEVTQEVEEKLAAEEEALREQAKELEAEEIALREEEKALREKAMEMEVGEKALLKEEREKLAAEEQALKKQAKELEAEEKALLKEEKTLAKERIKLEKENQVAKTLLKMLEDDKLIEKNGSLDFQISDKGLILNGVKQPKWVFEKYRKFFKNKEGSNKKEGGNKKTEASSFHIKQRWNRD